MPLPTSLEPGFLHCGVTFSSPCSHSDLPFLLPNAILARLGSFPSHDLVLFFFFFGKGGDGVLANCFLCGTEVTLSFSASPVCSSFFAEAFTILQALFWSRQHQQLCHYFSNPLLSPSCPLLRFSFYLNLSSRNCPLSLLVLSGYNGSPDTRFPRNDAADELVKQKGLLVLSTIPCSLSPLISRMHSLTFLQLEAHCLN